MAMPVSPRCGLEYKMVVYFWATVFIVSMITTLIGALLVDNTLASIGVAGIIITLAVALIAIFKKP